ncbi:prolyl oligopeptidase family serine peptidase [Paenibacillus sp. WQ 127069]|uniref:Prolyl oligopeptidase family serine peptidase n=1 Tax=Paenibacillus baimaensis TaxID=2982185 RepID=A0ABT2UQH5_9BACL|nr:prolyl oligopeptidase family serine peptidase [Paenibacillus sp. WQ 127069]MCU6796296.1 prolyl oligopeptidase family serine peptidase [Paenibacillus sp. WQ 127069]
MDYERYEDRIRPDNEQAVFRGNRYSPYCDLIYYTSSRNPAVRLAMRVLKPAKPAPMLVTTHGWHMSIPEFVYMDEPYGEGKYVVVEVDMRGRAFSTGSPDCNGWELLDIIDAVAYVRQHYEACLIEPDVVYFEAGSGGGGNAYALIGKFPDFFAAATAMCGITDYAVWYEQDEIGEFRDELDIWIGCSPDDDAMAYRSRSGLEVLPNLLTPLFIAHGQTDIRVPVEHARMYRERARMLGLEEKISYLELEGVGTREHWGGATHEQMRAMAELSEQNRQRFHSPITIPEQGSFIVAGYLMTKRFSVVLDSLDRVAVIEYDLPGNTFRLRSEPNCGYTITRRD